MALYTDLVAQMVRRSVCWS